MFYSDLRSRRNRYRVVSHRSYQDRNPPKEEQEERHGILTEPLSLCESLTTVNKVNKVKKATFHSSAGGLLISLSGHWTYRHIHTIESVSNGKSDAKPTATFPAKQQCHKLLLC